jgi:FMN phosphatase YigB (HAD superfamily)
MVESVLLDWRGVLVADPPDAWWIETALASIGVDASLPAVAEIAGRLQRADTEKVLQARLWADCSAHLHRAATMLHFREAGLEPNFAEALYRLDVEPRAHPFAIDVAHLLRALKSRGILVAVVSDVHFDPQPEFVAAGLECCIDSFVLSFEHHGQEPDPRMFNLALDELGTPPNHSFMVGDRASRDGGAIQVGIPTLLLPTLRHPDDSLLSIVLRLAANHSA